MIKQGQNKIFRALIWGKVGLCRPKWPEIWQKRKNRDFLKKSIYATKLQENAKFDTFWKSVFAFFIISLVIFGLQRPTLPRVIKSYVVNFKIDILTFFRADSESFGKWYVEKW